MPFRENYFPNVTVLKNDVIRLCPDGVGCVSLESVYPSIRTELSEYRRVLLFPTQDIIHYAYLYLDRGYVNIWRLVRVKSTKRKARIDGISYELNRLDLHMEEEEDRGRQNFLSYLWGMHNNNIFRADRVLPQKKRRLVSYGISFFW